MEKEVRAGYGDIIDYLQSGKREMLHQGLKFDIAWFTEKAVSGCSPVENICMFTDFVSNYKGSDIELHLSEFQCYGDLSLEELVRAKICNIPLIEFAKLNSPSMVSALKDLGAEEIVTEESQNADLVRETAALFGLLPSKQDPLEQAVSLYKTIFGDKKDV